MALNDIKWLQPYLTNSSNSGNITVSLGDGLNAVLALDEVSAQLNTCNNNTVPREHFDSLECAGVAKSWFRGLSRRVFK